MRIISRFHVKGRGWIVCCEPWSATAPRVGDTLVRSDGAQYVIRGVESARVGDGTRGPFGLLLREGDGLPDEGDEVTMEPMTTPERTSGGAPLDPEEEALLAALRARGMNELAEMALYCFGDDRGHAATALRELSDDARRGWPSGVAGGGGAGGVGHGGFGAGSSTTGASGGNGRNDGQVGGGGGGSWSPQMIAGGAGWSGAGAGFEPVAATGGPGPRVEQRTGFGGPADPHRLLIEVARLVTEQRQRAIQRFVELQPECAAAFRSKKLVADDRRAQNAMAFGPSDVAAWLDARGLHATVHVDSRDPGDLIIDPIRVKE